MNQIATLKLTRLDEWQVPVAYFARFAGFGRVTVALWMSAARRGENRPMRPLYWQRANECMQVVANARAAGRLKHPKTMRYQDFVSALTATV